MKTNHKLSIMQMLLCVGCGLVLALQRKLTNAIGSELVLVALAAMLVCTLCALGVESTRKKLMLKPAILDKGAFGLLATAGFLFLVTAALTLLDRSSGIALTVISAVFAATAGVMTLMRLSIRDEGETAAVFALVPNFYLSFFLLMFYRANGDNPYLRQFGYETSVILILLVCIYGAVAGRFERPRPRFRATLCGIGLMFVLQELIFMLLDPAMLTYVSGFGYAAVTMLLAYALLLTLGLFYPPVREVFPIKTEKAHEEEKTEE